MHSNESTLSQYDIRNPYPTLFFLQLFRLVSPLVHALIQKLQLLCQNFYTITAEDTCLHLTLA